LAKKQLPHLTMPEPAWSRWKTRLSAGKAGRDMAWPYCSSSVRCWSDSCRGLLSDDFLHSI